MELKGNAVCYSRVSTKTETQEDSLEQQELLLEKFIADNPGLISVGIYKDQESGKTTERKGFLNLLERVSRGDVDYILTKNNTRISRSTEISASLNRICQKHDCKIVFVGTGEIYDPTDRASVLMNSIKSAVAEDLVYQQSELGKLTHMIKCRDARLSAQNETYGYRFNKETQKMDVVEEEAAVVRLMFELYCYRNMGVSEIGRELARVGVYGKHSGKSLNGNTVTNRLKDTAYIGKMAFNKSESELVTGVGAKSIRKKIPKSEWVYAECPAIISEELFELAQKIREERKHVFYKQDTDKKAVAQARFRGYHLFATKVFCGTCGNPYHHSHGDRKKKVSVYKDSFLKKGHKPGERCSNESYNQIYEDQLIEITINAINTFLENKEEIFENVYQVIEEVLKSEKGEDTDKANKKLLDQKNTEKETWLNAYKDAVAMGDEAFKADVLSKYKQIVSEIEELKKLIGSKEDEKKDIKSIVDRLDRIKERIMSMKHVTELTREDVMALVDRIIINKDGVVEVHLLFAESYSYNVLPYKEYKKTLKERESSILFLEVLTAGQIGEIVYIPMLNSGMTGHFRPVMATQSKVCCADWNPCFYRRQTTQ